MRTNAFNPSPDGEVKTEYTYLSFINSNLLSSMFPSKPSKSKQINPL